MQFPNSYIYIIWLESAFTKSFWKLQGFSIRKDSQKDTPFLQPRAWVLRVEEV